MIVDNVYVVPTDTNADLENVDLVFNLFTIYTFIMKTVYA